MNELNTEVAALIDDVDAQVQKERRVLALLLDKYAQLSGKVFAIRSEMGYTMEDTGQRIKIPSFTVVQSLDWVGKEVKMGSQMPFMQGHIDAKGRLKVDESIAESVKQRAPDWTRQAAITAYLAHDKRRKFGTIVGVLNPPWVDDAKHENWTTVDGKPRAVKSAYKFEALDGRGRIGLLDLTDIHIYALDGQHRIMGIRGIQDLQYNGFLTMKTKDGVDKKGQRITRDEFMSKFNMDIAELQGLLNETITLELIPAVIAGEPMDQASQRVRSVFITINAYAQRTGAGEEALLDESDGFAIVARKSGTLHPLFVPDRVNWKTSSLPQRSRWYTTLDTLKSMVELYLPQVDPDLTSTWPPQFKGQVPIRPDESAIEKGRAEFFEFLDRLRSLPVFAGLDRGDDLDEVRFFPNEHANGKGHLLVRPVGQMILANAVGKLVKEGFTLDEIFTRLAKWDGLGGFTQHKPSSVWYGITYDFHNQKMNTRTNENLGVRLLTYMVRGSAEPDRTDLINDVVKSRNMGGPENRPRWIDFDGKESEYDPANPGKGKDLPVPIDRM